MQHQNSNTAACVMTGYDVIISDRAALLLDGTKRERVWTGVVIVTARAKIFCLGQGQGQTVDALCAGSQR